MECKDLSELLSDYYDNTLSAFNKETVTKHLLSCKKCNLKYRTYCEALVYLKAVPDEELPGEFYAGLDKKINEVEQPFYLKYLPYLTLKNASVGVLGLLFGLVIGVYFSGSLTVKTPRVFPEQTVSAPVETEKSTGRIMMRTGNVYKAGFELDKLVNRYDNAGLEAVSAGQEPVMRVLNKKYIITVNAGQYDNLVKELNALGYVMKLPNKKELAEIKTLKPTDQIKFELDITEDGK